MKNLAITLALAALLTACGSRQPDTTADLILLNGHIYTANDAQPQVQAIAVKDGKILAAGSDAEVRALAGTDTQVLDLAGKRVMPGLIDAHTHPIAGGMSLSAANMDDEIVELAELETRLRQWRDDGRAQLAEGILQIVGMNSAYWAQAKALDERFSQGEWADTAVLLLGSDHHTAWANAKLRQLAGLDKALLASLPAAERANIGAFADGQPSGFVVDSGLDRVSAALPPESPETLLHGAQAAVQYYNAVGVTGWLDAAAASAPKADEAADAPSPRTLGMLPGYKALAEKGGLNAHVAALIVANPKSRPQDLDAVETIRAQFAGIPNLTLPGIKIFADGVLEYPAHSAALLEPYTDSGKPGELLIDPQHFGELVTAADKRGWLVHVHAIGDRAVRESLNGYEQARKAGDSGIAHSITHLQLVSPDDFPRFKQLNVIAAMQLLWAAGDEYTIDMVQPYISATAFKYQYPANSLLRAGATLAGASDWPVSSGNPWEAIAQAMTRKGDKGVLNSDEIVPREAMFQAYTLNAAKVLQLESKIGSLAAGKQADFVVLDRDVFTVTPEELAETKALSTWFAGKVVYQAGE
ncbi:MAG: amidohydrolase [Pseudoxanthomonas sp.]